MSTIMNALQQITEENLLDIDQAKAGGRSAIGFYCLYSPMEMTSAHPVDRGAGGRGE